MEVNYIKIIETLVVLLAYVVFRYICFRIIDRTLAKRFLHESRGTLAKKAVNITFLTICVTFVLFIWGVNQADLAIFIGSALTILGVGLFAQWSILSNITSSIILFFSHPVKINDYISLLEGKDYVLEGKVVNIGLYFVTLLTNENEEITLPNNVFIQKTIRKKVEESNEEIQTVQPQ